MTVGLLIITHSGLGEALLDTARQILGHLPLTVRLLAVHEDEDPSECLSGARTLAAELDQGAGVLVLTDLYGSTPSNIANQLLDHPRLHVVSGVNLPMLMRVMNYPGLTVQDLVKKAVSGGKDGIIHCTVAS